MKGAAGYLSVPHLLPSEDDFHVTFSSRFLIELVSTLHSRRMGQLHDMVVGGLRQASTRWPYITCGKFMKLGRTAVVQLIIAAALLTNAWTCLHPNRISAALPSIEAYFSVRSTSSNNGVSETHNRSTSDGSDTLALAAAATAAVVGGGAGDGGL